MRKRNTERNWHRTYYLLVNAIRFVGFLRAGGGGEREEGVREGFHA